MEFEDILLHVGDFGKYQKRLIMFFLVPTSVIIPLFCLNIIFMMSVPDHWCNVPELVSSNLTLARQRSLVSPPDEQCAMYNISYGEIENLGSFTVASNYSTRPCDRGWQFDNTDYDYNVATQFNLVCSDRHYTSFVFTMYSVGTIVGTPIYGALADRIGRKITFFIVTIVTAVSGIASVLMTNFIAFVIFKTIHGGLMPSLFQLPFITVLELVAPEKRTRMNGISNVAWAMGSSLLSLIAYYSRNWVVLGLSTSVLTVLLMAYYTFLPESPRWMVSQERYEEATEIMCRIGKTNGRDVEKKDLVIKLKKLGEKMKKEQEEQGVENSSLDLVRYPQLRKTFFIISVCWMADAISFNGIQINMTNLSGNEFINFFLLSIAEIPGYLTFWVLMERYGRRWSCAGGFLLTGIVCMLVLIDFPYSDVVFSVIGKFSSSGTFLATYQQSSELYPTVVRSLGMGMSSTVSMLITLVVPYIVYLGIYGKAIPFVIIGSFCIVAGFAATFLPETLNENLPQTISDAENFGKNQKFFSMNRRKCSVSRERAASLRRKSVDSFPTSKL